MPIIPWGGLGWWRVYCALAQGTGHGDAGSLALPRSQAVFGDAEFKGDLRQSPAPTLGAVLCLRPFIKEDAFPHVMEKNQRAEQSPPPELSTEDKCLL